MEHTGLQIAQAIKAGKFISTLPPWVEHMKVHEENLVEVVEVGRVCSVWTPGKQFTVPDGYVQGGLITAMADGSQGLAVMTTHETIEAWVTRDLHIRFARPIKAGTRVDIESKVIERTAANAIVETTLRLPENKLAAKVTGSWQKTNSRQPFQAADGNEA